MEFKRGMGFCMSKPTNRMNTDDNPKQAEEGHGQFRWRCTYSEGIQRYLTGSELPCFDDTAESRRPGLENGCCLGSVDDDGGSTRPAKTILFLSVCLSSSGFHSRQKAELDG
jgi:hypothetical protein